MRPLLRWFWFYLVKSSRRKATEWQQECLAIHRRHLVMGVLVRIHADNAAGANIRSPKTNPSCFIKPKILEYVSIQI